ncbi:MAG: EscU/YscU/HrcU family type III secretion system export apparatus switch protein [Deltaproteobacteria bacterium]|nr:EscU/YscU/HrcU family type III secretion system export apparatus switch protein [Deltaproteobacteria bacterium]
MGAETGEKTEEATPEKLRKSKEEGQVPKSQDFVSALGFVAGFFTLVALLDYIATEVMDFTRQSLEAAFRAPSPSTIAQLLENAIPFLLRISLPIGAAVLVTGVFSNVLQTGFFLAFKVLKPKMDKINPINGLKGMFKVKKFVDLAKNMLKVAIAAWLAWSIISKAVYDMTLSVTLPMASAIEFGRGVIWEYLVKTAALFIVIGGADLLWARRVFQKEMMMSKYDVKQEYKQSEGDPQMKGQRRQLAQELLFGGGMENVKNADAVIVNPTHIAVAIKYDKKKGKDAAPTVVAKGMRIHAEKIKELAKHYGVPILRNVPLAQALNKLDIDEEIPEELYEAVAEVLSFVFKIKEEQEARQKEQRSRTADRAEADRAARAQNARLGRHAQTPDVGGKVGGNSAPGKASDEEMTARDNLLKRPK